MESSKERFLEHVRSLEVGRDEATAEVRLLRIELGASRVETRQMHERFQHELRSLEAVRTEQAQHGREFEAQLREVRAERSQADAAARRSRLELLTSMGRDASLAEAADEFQPVVKAAVALRRSRDELRETTGSLRKKFDVAAADRDALSIRLKAAEREGDRGAAELRACRRNASEVKEAVQLCEARLESLRTERDEAKCCEAVMAQHSAQEAHLLREALQEKTAKVRQMEAEELASLHREEAWRADLAARVHQAFLEGSSDRNYSSQVLSEHHNGHRIHGAAGTFVEVGLPQQRRLAMRPRSPGASSSPQSCRSFGRPGSRAHGPLSPGGFSSPSEPVAAASPVWSAAFSAAAAASVAPRPVSPGAWRGTSEPVAAAAPMQPAVSSSPSAAAAVSVAPRAVLSSSFRGPSEPVAAHSPVQPAAPSSPSPSHAAAVASPVAAGSDVYSRWRETPSKERPVEGTLPPFPGGVGGASLPARAS
eukprot:CAMPEP_0177222922 /NCGR_PEP_ID=MMETSP0367-20130122/38200_1 /TAXON_ID=447022 ORGANISM="Scrippsiella hangoei-like, Strain SHHI-4" /NCGR_SAMPLE_ID=MMETSP0367 /ASSEMBLY_ACC=CAM_ASM_000362 /LENGTH=480 /DNA_ID=CAMNT_0018672839 /DNA_START=13 /DNA_END=1451 /DNA_ORIENTATION=+